MRVSVFLIFLLVSSCTSRPTSKIKNLDLSDRNLTAVPDSVFSLTQLEYLELGNRSGWTMYPPLSALVDHGSGDSANRITEIPNDIKRLSHLRTLKLSALELSSLPEGITQLDNLDSLDISFNQNLDIKSGLAQFKEMHGLRYLNIIGTKADPETIVELRKLLPETKIKVTFHDL